MIVPNSRQTDLLDDKGIVGGSPTDRVIGMLLERTEAIRELHDAMRNEFRELIDTHTDVKNMVARMAEKHESHERADLAAFAAVNASNAIVGAKLDALCSQLNAATTASVIQKAQFNAGWKVIVYIGGVIAASFAIFSIFFNHDWGVK